MSTTFGSFLHLTFSPASKDEDKISLLALNFVSPINLQSASNIALNFEHNISAMEMHNLVSVTANKV